MNKKGFTLVEILSVLVLIGLLLGLAIPGINKISSNMKKKSYSKKVSLVESAAELWGQDNKTLLQSSSDCEIKGGEKVSCYKITVGSLIENNYLDSDKNSGEYISPLDNSDMKNQCVYVYKKNNRVYSYYSKNNNCLNDVDRLLLEKEVVIETSDKVASGNWHLNNEFYFKVKSQGDFTKTGKKSKIYYYDSNNSSMREYREYIDNEQLFKDKSSDMGTTYTFKMCTVDQEICSTETSYVVNLDTTSPTLSDDTFKLSSGSMHYKQFELKINYGGNVPIGSDYYLKNESGHKITDIDNKILVSDKKSYSVQLCDNNGNCTKTNTYSSNLVTTIPNLSYSPSNTKWTNNNVTVSVSNKNVYGKNAKIYFGNSIKNDGKNIYSSNKSGESVKICGNSNTLVENCTVPVSVDLKIDKEAPTITLTKNPISIKLYETVDLSSFAKVEDNLSGVKSLNYKGTVDNAKIGTYNITYTSEDNAGNETTKTLTVNVLPNQKNYIFAGIGTGGYNSYLSKYSYMNEKWNSTSIISGAYATSINVSAVDENTAFVGLATGGSNSYVRKYSYVNGKWNSTSIISGAYATNINVSAVDANTVFVGLATGGSNSYVRKYSYVNGKWNSTSIISGAYATNTNVSAVDENTVFVGLATGGNNSYVSKYSYVNGKWNSTSLISRTYAKNVNVSAVDGNTVFTGIGTDGNNSYLGRYSYSNGKWNSTSIINRTYANNIQLGSLR